MNLKEIKEIVALMNENDLAEIEVEHDGVKLKIKKAAEGVTVEHPLHSSVVYRPEPVVPPPAAVPASTPAVAVPSLASNYKTITSPMVGTFYRAPSPEAPPFVDLGQIVEVGQVVCIVEAMKLMNEIKAEIRGKIVEIPVQNAEPVEFGQVLFVLEPA